MLLNLAYFHNYGSISVICKYFKKIIKWRAFRVNQYVVL